MYDSLNTYPLDLTTEKVKGKALEDRIDEIVGDSQAFVLTPLPGKLKLTRTQFESLLTSDRLQEMVEYNQFTGEIQPIKDALFKTKHNAMEVEVEEDNQWQNTEMLKHLDISE